MDEHSGAVVFSSDAAEVKTLTSQFDDGRSPQQFYLDVSKNSGTPKSSILIGFSIINHPFWGTPIFWKHPFFVCISSTKLLVYA